MWGPNARRPGRRENGILTAARTGMKKLVLALAFLISSVYAGVVFESLRRDRLEMQTLRRRLGEMAHTDPLTGLSNRRQFESILQAEMAALRRYLRGIYSFIALPIP